MRDVEPVGEDDEAEAFIFHVARDLVYFDGVVLLLGVDDQERACFFFLRGSREREGESKKQKQRGEREEGKEREVSFSRKFSRKKKENHQEKPSLSLSLVP